MTQEQTIQMMYDYLEPLCYYDSADYLDWLMREDAWQNPRDDKTVGVAFGEIIYSEVIG